jgi:hypothetical protein
MELNEADKIEELISLPETLGLSEFDDFVNRYLERKADKALALKDLDSIIANLQNHVLTLSIHIKQNYLTDRKFQPAAIKGIPAASQSPAMEEEITFSKQEIADSLGIDIRTVTNWIRDGLKTTPWRGGLRISKDSLEEFSRNKRGKKFHWRSIARPNQKALGG